jgi:hypothetical protein
MAKIINISDAAIFSIHTLLNVPTYNAADLKDFTKLYWDKLNIDSTLGRSFLFPFSDVRRIFECSENAFFKQDVAVIVENINNPFIVKAEIKRLDIFQKIKLFFISDDNTYVFIIPRRYSIGYINTDPSNLNDFSESWYKGAPVLTKQHRMGIIASADSINANDKTRQIVGLSISIAYNPAIPEENIPESFGFSLNLIGKDIHSGLMGLVAAIGPDGSATGIKIPPQGN